MNTTKQTTPQPAYVAMLEQCKHVNENPQKMVELFRAAFQEVAEYSFDQGFDSGLATCKEAVSSALAMGYSEGLKARTKRK